VGHVGPHPVRHGGSKLTNELLKDRFGD
jgi:hypothetical protein